MSCGRPESEARDRAVFYASGADLQSINPLLTVHPLAKAVQKHVLFVTLASYDSALRPVPRLASWEWDRSRTVLTLRLRDDLTWGDGVPTTARDVVWTLEAARAPEVAYPRARNLGGVETVEALDAYVARVRFRRPQPTFPDVLTDLAILPAHLFEGLELREIRTAPFNRRPIGTGPFEFVEYRPNQRWVFRRRESFPARLGRPSIERFVVAVVHEPSTKLAALTSGELDFAGISPAHAEFVRADPTLDVVDFPSLFVYAVVWNHRRSPFDERGVRTALTMAIDRQLIVDAYLFGFGTPADGPVPPEHPWYEPVERVPYDPDAARLMLGSAGWRLGADGVRERDGQALSFELMTVGSGDAALEQMIQAQLRQVGVSVRIRQLELSTFLATAQGPRRDFDAMVIGLPGDLSLGYVAALFAGDGAGPLAYAGYRSGPFDEAVERAARARTELELQEAWSEAQRILSRDHPVTWLYHARGLHGVNRRVRHPPTDLRGELARISEWRILREDGSQ
ncbi:MAG: ABC transporter substrate-binding protein [Gemmatimonadales bacterium]